MVATHPGKSQLPLGSPFPAFPRHRAEGGRNVQPSIPAPVRTVTPVGAQRGSPGSGTEPGRQHRGRAEQEVSLSPPNACKAHVRQGGGRKMSDAKTQRALAAHPLGAWCFAG